MPIDRSKLIGKRPVAQPEATLAGGGLTAAARARLMAVPGVQGVGIGSGGQVLVYISDPVAVRKLPSSLEGHAVQVERIGTVKAY